MSQRPLIVLLLLMTQVIGGCSILPRSWQRKTHFTPADLRSENPVVQVRAIHEVVDQKDQTQVPTLLDLMDAEEPSVRNHAYWGVTQLTGRDRPSPVASEFHYYDPPAARKEALEAWKSYWKENAGDSTRK